MSNLRGLEDVHMCVQKSLNNELSQIVSGAKNQEHHDILLAAFQRAKLWPADKKELTIQFCTTSDYTIQGQPLPPQQPLQWTPLQILGLQNNSLAKKIQGSTDYPNAVKTVLIEWLQPIIPFKLNFVESGGEIRVGFVAGKGSWSLVGTDCLRSEPNELTMNFGWADVATFVHEFGHVLGLIHEHQNPRGAPIEWNLPVLYKWAAVTQGWDQQTTYSNIVMKYSLDSINGSDYDPKSIMLYFFPGKLCFRGDNLDPGSRVPCPPGENEVNFTKNGVGTSINSLLSPTDIEWIKKVYPGGTGPNPPTSQPTGSDGGKPIEVRISLPNIKKHPIFMVVIILLVIFILLIILKM